MDFLETHANEIIGLSGYDGVVHIETIGHHDLHLTINARELMRDLPSIYYMCKKAIAEEDQRTFDKFRDFEKEIAKDFKRPVGRPKGSN